MNRGLGAITKQHRKTEDVGDEGSGEEFGVRKSMKRPNPREPSRAEREEHEKTHTPYRCWCPYCVRGRGMKMQHRRKGGKEGEDEKAMHVPRIAMDYFFMSVEDEEDQKNPMVVMVDEETGNKYMRSVDHKGLGEDTCTKNSSLGGIPVVVETLSY